MSPYSQNNDKVKNLIKRTLWTSNQRTLKSQVYYYQFDLDFQIVPFKMDFSEIQIEQIEIKQEILEDDEDYLFEFKLTEDEYFEIVKELRAKDGDLIEVEQTLIKCDSESCTKMFKNKKLLWKHKKRKHFSPDLVTDEYSICHLCGKNIKMRSYAQHIKNHE